MTLILYELDDVYQRLAEVTADEEASETGAAGRLEQDLTALLDELPAQVMALAKVVTGLEAEADLLEQHGRGILARASSRRNRAEALKRWIQLQMTGAGIDRLRDAFLTVWLQQSPPSVQVLDEGALPAAFKRAVLRLPYSLLPEELRGFVEHLDVDRRAILELVRRTGELPGGISVTTGEKHLRIR